MQLLSSIIDVRVGIDLGLDFSEIEINFADFAFADFVFAVSKERLKPVSHDQVYDFRMALVSLQYDRRCIFGHHKISYLFEQARLLPLHFLQILP